MAERLSRRDFIKLAGVAILGLGGIAAAPRLFENRTEDDARTVDLLELTSEQQKFLTDHPINRGDTSRPQIMMTYDDWPYNPEQLSEILDAYKGKGRTTFFMIGKMINYLADGSLKPYGWPNTDIIKRIVDEGHEIGCHGWQHDIPMTQLKDSTLSLQFEQWFEALHKILPNQPVSFFRAPYGAESEGVRKVAAKFGLQHVMWGVEV